MRGRKNGTWRCTKRLQRAHVKRGRQVQQPSPHRHQTGRHYIDTNIVIHCHSPPHRMCEMCRKREKRTKRATRLRELIWKTRWASTKERKFNSVGGTATFAKLIEKLLERRKKDVRSSAGPLSWYGFYVRWSNDLLMLAWNSCATPAS